MKLALFIIVVLIALLIPWMPAIAADGSTSAKDWLLLVFGFDWLNVLLAAFGVFAFGLLVWWQTRPGDGFDLRAMLARQNHDRTWTIEPGRAYQTGAFLATTWGWFWVVTHDKLTEMFLLVYVALWAGSRAINQIVAARFPLPPPMPPDMPVPDPPSPTVTVTTEVKP